MMSIIVNLWRVSNIRPPIKISLYYQIYLFYKYLSVIIRLEILYLDHIQPRMTR